MVDEVGDYPAASIDAPATIAPMAKSPSVTKDLAPGAYPTASNFQVCRMIPVAPLRAQTRATPIVLLYPLLLLPPPCFGKGLTPTSICLRFFCR